MNSGTGSNNCNVVTSPSRSPATSQGQCILIRLMKMRFTGDIERKDGVGMLPLA
ncbi:hypothetical protein TanjilG_27694 [Lupinus angustifolius]|uniref:Uncharacterized protein n=1 Tax=Lupinus angustifolius TaxID=3871 RepID=A0A4P1RGX7_LUPAN|nr:hypothetical protein TanjilG_27694 [Lupinus angustifolius]